MANKNKPEASDASESLKDGISRDDIMAELLDTDTVRETNTVVEDRTDNPVELVEPEYAVEVTELDGGTKLTSYGDAVVA